MSSSAEELLFAAAAGFDDDAERQAFLDYACRDQPELRRRLEDLLKLQAEADLFFEFQPDVPPADRPPEGAGEEDVQTRIGCYRLLRRIGAGGCGVVYEAEQEEPVRRKVALKIIKFGTDTEMVNARFELERHALAQMDHPNIARVLDAGATDSGWPYFVMELVEGARISDFCDANRLGIRPRLELFLEVCRAVQHAHQKGIIHRDLKPSNILVRFQDGVPTPKVIDFGIVKTTAGAPAGGPAASPDRYIGTPAYMSPEQAQGSADVDTRSDIYSLGVLLYELLSGRSPFGPERLDGRTSAEIRRIIRDQEPVRPSEAFRAAPAEQQAAIARSRATDAPRLGRQLAGDLDWIVMKAMEKDRSRRYETSTGLALDVLRCLNDEAVAARPPSRAYRLGKLVRRNKLVFLATGIAVLGLLGGIGVSTGMFFRERAARLEQARLRENADRLRHEAEIRALVARAAVKVKYGDLEGADRLLAEVPVDQAPSSLEAASTFAAVADWNAQAVRWEVAAERYSSMIRALASVDDADLPLVSFGLLPAAAAVGYAEGPEKYEELRRLALERFGATVNPQVAEQTLKGCLIFPADGKTLQSLAPLAALVDRAIARKEGVIGQNWYNAAWACFALSLWHYRVDDLARGAEWATRSLSSRDQNQARIASTLIVQAMIEQKSGRSREAQTSLAQGRAVVQDAFSKKRWMTTTWPVFWFDWMIASTLLVEAERLIDGKR